MQIHLEKAEDHTIQSYSNDTVKVNHTIYQDSFILHKTALAPWPLNSIQQLTLELLDPILQYNPEIILMGHPLPGVYGPIAILEKLSQLRIGIECMLIGAACRTFNVLLSEQRAVVLGIIFPSASLG